MEDGRLRLFFSPTDYREYLGTNHNREEVRHLMGEREPQALALVTFQGAKILAHRLVTLKQGDNVLDVPMEAHLAPNFYLTRYFTDVNTPSFSDLNVANPDFFKQVNGVVESESLDALKIYDTIAQNFTPEPTLSAPIN